MIALINSKKVMENVMTIVKSFKESGLFIKGVGKTIDIIAWKFESYFRVFLHPVTFAP